MSNSVHAEVQTKEKYKHVVKITSCQWKVYYYLLSISKYNAQKREDHRYIYKKDFNVTKFADRIGVSRGTVYNSIKALEKYFLIVNKPDYYLLYAENWVDIKVDILKSLLTWSKEKDCYVDLLRTFLSLKKMILTAQSALDVQFTARDLCLILGHNDTDDYSYFNVRFYLALMSQWGLIELKTHVGYKEGLKPYTIYHLQKVQEENLDPSFYIDLQTDKDSHFMSQERIDSLKFSFPEIIGE